MGAARAETLGETRKHYWLALGMAKAVGVDLVAAWKDGALRRRCGQTWCTAAGAAPGNASGPAAAAGSCVRT
jgi:hypothetical protein